MSFPSKEGVSWLAGRARENGVWVVGVGWIWVSWAPMWACGWMNVWMGETCGWMWRGGRLPRAAEVWTVGRDGGALGLAGTGIISLFEEADGRDRPWGGVTGVVVGWPTADGVGDQVGGTWYTVRQ